MKKYIISMLSIVFLAAPGFAFDPITWGTLVGTFIATSCGSGGVVYALKDSKTEKQNKEMLNYKGDPAISRDTQNPNTLYFLGKTYQETDLYKKYNASVLQDANGDRMSMQGCEKKNPISLASKEVSQRRQEGWEPVTQNQRSGNDILLTFRKKISNNRVQDSKDVYSYLVVRYATSNGNVYRLMTMNKVGGTEENRNKTERAILDGVSKTPPGIFNRATKIDGDCHFGSDCRK